VRGAITGWPIFSFNPPFLEAFFFATTESFTWVLIIATKSFETLWPSNTTSTTMKSIIFFFALLLTISSAERGGENASRELRKDKQKGEKSGGKGGGNGNIVPTPYNGLCPGSPPYEDTFGSCVCNPDNKVRPNSMTFIWKSSGQTSMYQAQKSTSCGAGTYPSPATVTINGQTKTVRNGDEFKIFGPWQANTPIVIAGFNENNPCTFHTSCSQPLIPGDTMGPLYLVGDEECEASGTQNPDEICCICYTESKKRPDELYFIYKSAGKDSMYQPEKSTCTEGTYPSTGVTVTANGQTFRGLKDGDTFVVKGPFDANTDFVVQAPSFAYDCSIHTSCSQPLLAGDQFGPFLLTLPDICLAECLVVDKAVYSCGDPITVSYDYDGAIDDSGVPNTQRPLGDDWIGIYPCSATIPYYLPEVWKYSCSDSCDQCYDLDVPLSGEVTFNSLPPCNQFGPHKWPVAPFRGSSTADPDGINRCFRAVLLRFDAPSPPPYIAICQSPEFRITDSSRPGCQVRNRSPSVGRE
jgi:hypothetical protein